MNQIVFKWCSNENLPNDLYQMTSEQVGFSRLDDFPIYAIRFDCGIGVLKLLYDDTNNDIFTEVSKQLRKYKIQKIIHNVKGEVYKNTDLDKFSTFLQYYYSGKGNINIIEQTKV